MSRYAGVFDLDRLLFETNICHQAIFYRRELFAGIGPYNLRYPVWADWDFNIRCFSNPALVTRYMDIVVAHHNDMTGLWASKGADKEFKKRLPRFFWASALETIGRALAHLMRKEDRRLALRQWSINYRAATQRSARDARSKSIPVAAERTRRRPRRPVTTRNSPTKHAVTAPSRSDPDDKHSPPQTPYPKTSEKRSPRLTAPILTKNPDSRRNADSVLGEAVNSVRETPLHCAV